MSIFSNGDFFVKLDKNDKGKTKDALPTKTSPSRIPLTWIEVFGLKKGKKLQTKKNLQAKYKK